ncbi:hypothetical protein [Leptothrix ochracea]|uniref:hypothetical protein n=1 Tax=Leptothrix ochracea TaxID=735331 RepID=UPI0034E2F197
MPDTFGPHRQEVEMVRWMRGVVLGVLAGLVGCHATEEVMPPSRHLQAGLPGSLPPLSRMSAAALAEVHDHLAMAAPALWPYANALRADYRERHQTEIERDPSTGRIQSLALFLHEAAHDYVPDLILLSGEVLIYQRRVRLDPPLALPLTEPPPHFLPPDPLRSSGQNARYHTLYVAQAQPDRRPFVVLLNELDAYTIDFAYELSSFEVLRRGALLRTEVTTGLPYFFHAIARYLDQAEHADYATKTETLDELRRNSAVIARVVQQASEWIGQGCTRRFEGFVIDAGQKQALRQGYVDLAHQTLLRSVPVLPKACAKVL